MPTARNAATRRPARDRGFYYHHPSRHSSNQPITAGWSYQWITGLCWEADSWTPPVDAVGIPPSVDTAQPRTVLAVLPTSLRHRTHVPARQDHPRLDHP